MIAEARTPDSCARLRLVAAAARRVRRPGIVEVLEVLDDGDRVTVVTTDPAGPLVALDREGLRHLAVTLAELHATGVASGAIADTGADQAGRPVLVLPAWAGEPPMPADDVTALGRLLRSRLGPPDGPLIGRIPTGLERLTDWIETTTPPAVDIVAAIAPARPRALAAGTTTTRHGRHTIGRSVVAALAVATAVAVGAAVVFGRDDRRRDDTVVAEPSPDRTITVGAHRYVVGAPGDHVLVAAFGCGPDRVERAVVVRPATGDVFAFGGWDDGARAERVAALEPGETARAVERGGCVVLHVGGRHVEVDARTSAQPQ